VETELSSISEKARKEQEYRFKNLVYLVNAENLKDSFYRLKADKASGIDGVSTDKYEDNLESNVQDLVERMKRQAYKPQAVRRTYIPKANGKLRPLGIQGIFILFLCTVLMQYLIYQTISYNSAK
jgi:retron-type reverse transcriptase